MYRAGQQLVARVDVRLVAPLSNHTRKYFLWQILILYILSLKLGVLRGDLKKEEVREIANHFRLKNANKPDSQDICFIPDGNYREFVKKN